WALLILEVIGLIGLSLPQVGWGALWVILIGFDLGGTFGLGLLFIVFRSHNADSANELSGMAQSVGYLVAALGPLVFGSVFDLTGTWTYPLILLFAVSFLKLYMGLLAGKPGKI